MTNRKEKWLAWSFVVFIMVSNLLAWSPWLDAKRAIEWASSDFHNAQKGISDGCGVLDAIAKKKELFGYQVELFYDCGLKPIDSKEPPKSKTVFVTAVGIVF